MKAALLVIVLAFTGCDIQGLLKKDDAGSADASSTTASTAPSATATSSAAASATAAKDAGPSVVTAKNTGGKALPTCAADQALVTVALSPIRPVCLKKCSSDADCKALNLPCHELNQIKPDGMPGSLVKTCDTEYPLDAGASKTAAADATSPTPPKCKAGEHYDDINKKCRPEGDCPKGYAWNEPMKTCIMQ